MENLGKWNREEVEVPADMRAALGLPADRKLIMHKNTEGKNWYDEQKKYKTGTLFMIGEDGEIHGAQTDSSMIVPDNYEIWWDPDVTHPNPHELMGKKIDLETGEISDAPGPGEIPPAPERIPPLSPRQFFSGMAKQGVITEGEAMKFFKTRDIPEVMTNAIAMAIANGLLPEGVTQFDVESAVIAATEYEIDHPFTSLIAGVLGWTPEDLKAFWTFAAML
jgi:hypothetical protein